MHVSIAEQLLYADTGQPGLWRPLPDWARYVAHLGTRLAALRQDERRTVVAMAVPTRRFAGVLAAAGFVLTRDQEDPMDPKDLGLHWQWLRDQPINTAVKLLRKDRVEDGRIMGTQVREGIDLLEIKTRRGVCLFPRGQAAVVRLAPESAGSAQMLTRRMPAPPLLSALRTDTAAVSFMSATRVDCAIVGTATSIAADLTWEGFQAGDAGPDSAAGTLQDVVRANGVLGAASKYRAKVVPSVADMPDQDAMGAELAIFDGGRGYIQMREHWSRAHQLIVIDQAYAGSQDVADAVNARFLKRDAMSDVLGIEHPRSVEAIAFEEVVG